MQLSVYIGVPLFFSLGIGSDPSLKVAVFKAQAYWTIFSFSVAFLIIVLILVQEQKQAVRSEPKASVKVSSLWAIGGAFLALFVQSIAANIEVNVFGIDPGSENTQMIIDLVKITPLLIVVTSIIGPILEEIIFRKIIFRVIYRRTNFLIGALISSFLFAIVHGEPEHLLLYASMGLTFAYLYVKTNRIIVPIFAHTAMNSFVVLIQLLYGEEIEKMMNQMEQIQTIIGGI
nr:type II CAAX endopeptidase family protein [Bacillus sp. FJAT-47783]